MHQSNSRMHPNALVQLSQITLLFNATAMATTNPFTKVARQHETTWTQLHKRVSNISFRFEDIFPTSAEVEEAQEYISTEPDNAIQNLFEIIQSQQQSQEPFPYTFQEDAKALLKSQKDLFVVQVNEAIRDRSFLPPKCESS